ncbi:hypothetical protein PTQ27_02450 [Mannheimia sp. AT1]|uniref:Lipoprotein n=1 Tax=Mannheimia cairinae TaxID=3025936 RepID=A0ABT5MMC1_9PAST|nr:hypothetical protein [Mannheimia cairinae]MDD0823330.1 hypothetical protein [Mannheimia cairinae]MDD0827062.1 hypothetical protein [Mannheimia cairinae]
MKILISVFCLFLISACVQPTSFNKGFAKDNKNITASKKQLEYSKDTLIIFFDATVGDQHLTQAIKDVKANIIYRYGMMNGMAIKIDEKANLEQCLNYFKSVKGVLSVEKDYVTIIN